MSAGEGGGEGFDTAKARIGHIARALGANGPTAGTVRALLVLLGITASVLGSVVAWNVSIIEATLNANTMALSNIETALAVTRAHNDYQDERLNGHDVRLSEDDKRLRALETDFAIGHRP